MGGLLGRHDTMYTITQLMQLEEFYDKVLVHTVHICLYWVDRVQSSICQGLLEYDKVDCATVYDSDNTDGDILLYRINCFDL